MNATNTLIHQLRILYREKWTVLVCLIVVPVAAGVLSMRQAKAYSASAQVLLSNQDLAASLSGLPDTTATDIPDRRVQTQAGLARVPAIATRVLRTTGVKNLTPKDFLDSSSVSPGNNSDLMTFSVRMPTEGLAMLLANAYAKQYTLYKRQLDTAAVRQAVSDINTRLAQVQGGSNSGVYAELLRTLQSLKTLETLQNGNATVVKEADGATQVAPRVMRNVVLGAALGLLLGIGLALLRNALDTRVADEEIGQSTGAPLLGRVPRPPSRIRRSNSLTMIEKPHGPQAEAFRILRTNLDFVMLTREMQVLLVTSALAGEGKSPIAANLALACAQTEKRTGLIDLDLRRPAVDTLFAAPAVIGLTEVALGRVPMQKALLTVRATETRGGYTGPESASRSSDARALHVLPSGQLPPNPAEFVGSPAVRAILGELRNSFELLVVDAPPLLGVSDTLTLSNLVDGILFVSRPKPSRRHLEEAARALKACPAPTIGYVLVDTAVDTAYYGGYQAQGEVPPAATVKPLQASRRQA